MYMNKYDYLLKLWFLLSHLFLFFSLSADISLKNARVVKPLVGDLVIIRSESLEVRNKISIAMMVGTGV